MSVQAKPGEVGIPLLPFVATWDVREWPRWLHVNNESDGLSDVVGVINRVEGGHAFVTMLPRFSGLLSPDLPLGVAAAYLSSERRVLLAWLVPGGVA